MTSEQTVFVTMDLPDGEDWTWMPDVNVVGLSSRLDCEGRLRALDDLQRQWKRSHLSLVESA